MLPRTLLSVIVTLSIFASGCDYSHVAPEASGFLKANFSGSMHSVYEGTGTFRILPIGSASHRFSLVSSGTGASSGQGFSFLASEPLGVGEHRVGKSVSSTFRASYRHDEAGIRQIFEAQSGIVRISEAEEERIAGNFSITALLVQTCTIRTAFPTSVLECTPTSGDEEVEIIGSFVAGPLGGEDPGLTPSP